MLCIVFIIKTSNSRRFSVGDAYSTEFGLYIILNSLSHIHENYLEIFSEKKITFIKDIPFIIWHICK